MSTPAPHSIGSIRGMRHAVLVLLALIGPRPCHASEVNVAAASDLKPALDEVVAEFRGSEPSGVVTITYGSSANLFAQIQNGAPFDLYLSADLDYPRRLAAAGHALDGEVFVYAVGRIVVWTGARSGVAVEELGMGALLDPAVRSVAIANPRHAPYGRAAVAAMKSLGVYEAVEPKLVFGESVAQAAHFVQSGAAQVGIIALSLALAPPLRDAGRTWEPSLDAYPKLEQGGIVLNRARDIEAARRLRDFMLGQAGREVLQRFGFLLPPR